MRIRDGRKSSPGNKQWGISREITLNLRQVAGARRCDGPEVVREWPTDRTNWVTNQRSLHEWAGVYLCRPWQAGSFPSKHLITFYYLDQNWPLPLVLLCELPNVTYHHRCWMSDSISSTEVCMSSAYEHYTYPWFLPTLRKTLLPSPFCISKNKDFTRNALCLWGLCSPMN